MQSLSRSRDENLVVDIESALRLAQQQAQLTGSVEPLLAALRSADQRLERAGAAAAGPRARRDRARHRPHQGRQRRPTCPACWSGSTSWCGRSTSCRWPMRCPAPASRRGARKQAPAAPLRWWQRAWRDIARGGARPGAREPHRPARGRAAGARAGLLPAREPQAQAAQRAAGAAVAADRYGARRRGRRSGGPAASISTRRRAAPRPRPRQLQQVQAQVRTVELPRIDETLAALATAAAGQSRRAPMRAALWLLALFGIAVAGRAVRGQQPGHGDGVLAAVPRRPVAQPGAAAAARRPSSFLHAALRRAGGAVRPAAPGAALAHAAEGARHARVAARRACRTCWPAASSARASRPRRRWRRRASLAAPAASCRPTRRRCARWRTCWPPKARRRCRTGPAREEHLQQALEQASARDAPGNARRRADARRALVAGGPRARGRDGLAQGPAAGRRPPHAGAAHAPEGGAAGAAARARRWRPRACWPSTAPSRAARRRASCAGWRSTCSTAPTTWRSCSAPGTRWSPPSARCPKLAIHAAQRLAALRGDAHLARDWLLPVWEQQARAGRRPAREAGARAGGRPGLARRRLAGAHRSGAEGQPARRHPAVPGRHGLHEAPALGQGAAAADARRRWACRT